MMIRTRSIINFLFIPALKGEACTYFVESPHNLSIKDVIDILKTLDERYPEKIIVIGIDIKDLYTLSDKLSDNLERKLNYIFKKILEIINDEIKSNNSLNNSLLQRRILLQKFQTFLKVLQQLSFYKIFC